MASSFIPINKPIMGDEEVEAVKQVIASGILTDWRPQGGPMNRRFEECFASFIGVRYAVAVSSGSAALHAALLAAGVKPGDEVIVPAFTFPATANMVLMAGAKPVFADISTETYNIDLESVKKLISARTKAIIPVHLYGLPADMDPVMELAEEHGLMVIEDAAQAHGAKYKGRYTGTLGHMACFSFYPSKIISTGEGGMVTTNDEELALKLRSIRTHGQVKGFDSKILGHNYRMPEIEAAIGLVQMKRLPGFLEARRRNAKLLTEGLSDLDELKLPVEPPGLNHCWYLYTVRLTKRQYLRDLIVKRLNQAGIGAAIYYETPVPLLPLYSRLRRRSTYLNAIVASRSVFQLPVHPGVSEEQALNITKEVKKALT
ncbi:MAG: DegT/DnrJ/EryC1/StrS family aminotransferase [Candidatus Nezhaarchaeales archaeon]